jgi:hypothetical protein
VLATLIGAFAIRSLGLDDKASNAERSPGSSIRTGPNATSTTSNKPPAPGAHVTVKVDPNPYNLGSLDLLDIYGQNEDWMIPKGAKVMGAPNLGLQRDGLYKLAAKHDGVAVNRLFFSAAVQNLTGGAVYLRSMQVTNLTCIGPMRGTRITAGGGADYRPPRVVFLDLDASRPRPLLLPKAPEGFLDPKTYPGGLTRLAKRAKSFGFTLAKEETEPFDFVVTMKKHQKCEFKLVVQAIINGESQLVLIANDDEPFEIAGDPDLNSWFLTNGQHGFVWSRQGDQGQATEADVGEPGIDNPLTETDP